MPEIRLTVRGMSCLKCEARVERAAKAVAGVSAAKANHREDLLVLEVASEADARPGALAAIRGAIRGAGYEVVE
ncbi:heavy-metal-associated domain-containing protein [Candidatus Poribacteria bacterium]|nr:heavy-metal-associated domain-containing protein [Candidatus Poribacteria bacterium]